MRRVLATAATLLAWSSASLADGARVAVDLSRAAGGSEALVAIISQQTYADLAAAEGGKITRAKLKNRSVRTITVEADNGGGQATASADLFEIPDQDKPVICVLPSAAQAAGTVYVSLWTRTADKGPQFAGMEKLFPNDHAGSPKAGQQVPADTVFCVGQPGSGFALRARYAAGAQEQVYAHVTLSPDMQPESDDVVVLGKGVPGARAVAGDYWSGIAVYKVSK